MPTLKKRVNSLVAMKHSIGVPIALLPGRLILFLLFQLMLSVLPGIGADAPYYWVLSATLTNLVTIGLLGFLMRKEGLKYFSIFRIPKASIRSDFRHFIIITLIAGPVVFIPNYLLSILFWGDPEIPYLMMFKPLELPLILGLLLLFPLSIALAELAIYFGYIMPRLSGKLKRRWLVWVLPVLFLSLQHITLPFIPDPRFIAYRALVFLPFALLIGLVLHRKPRLLPYFAILHGLLDFATVYMLFKISLDH